MKKTAIKKRGPIRIAIIGTGGMANNHARQFNSFSGCKVVAGVDVDANRVKDFCDTHKIPEAYTDIDKMLKSADVDAVSIVTPDAYHMPVSLQCLKAKKHVLCEKPLALNYKDASKMTRAAQKAGVVNMVNFSYRDWPALQAVATLVQSGKIGDVRHVEASYLQAWLASKVWGDWRTTPAWLWRLSKKHGSNGVLGDVGVHIVDFASFPAGPVANVFCQLKAFKKAPRNRIGEYVLDANDSAVMTVEFTNGALGTIHTTRWCGGHANRLFLKIAGTKGTVEIDSEKSTTAYRICSGKDLDKAAWKDVKVKNTPNNYRRFISAIKTGKNTGADFARGAEVQKVLDACFKSDSSGRPVKVSK
jgi:predicted dehydrogenase